MTASLDPRLDANSPLKLMVWVVGGLVFVAFLLAVVAWLLSLQVDQLRKDNAQVTVSMNLGEQDSQNLIQDFVGRVSSLEGVRSIRVVPRDELTGNANQSPALQEIALPTLIQINHKPGSPVKIETLDQWVKAIDPAGEVRSSEASKSTRLSDLQIFSNVILASMVLCLGALIGITVITVKSSLNSHHETLDLLRTMGADDGDLARQFEAKATIPLLLGVATGSGLGIIGAGILFLAPIGRISWETDPNLLMEPLFWLSLALVPMIGGSCVVLAVKLAAKKYLALMR